MEQKTLCNEAKRYFELNDRRAELIKELRRTDDIIQETILRIEALAQNEFSYLEVFPNCLAVFNIKTNERLFINRDDIPGTEGSTNV